MHRPKNMSRGGWIVIGIVVGLLIVPSGVVAAKAALKFTGIEGTSGNKADVTSAAQVETADADPSNLYISNPALVQATAAGGPAASVVVAFASGHGIILNEITIDVSSDPSPGPNDYVQVYSADSDSCTPTDIYDNIVNPATIGLTSIPIPSGVAIHAGSALCALQSGSVVAEVEATGYQVPSASVPPGV
jgi:hypothetical protein